MQATATKSRPPAPKSGPFEFQNWAVYQRTLGLIRESYGLTKDSGIGPELADQLRRASTSILLNLSEGVSRYGLRDKANFWRIAKGSLFECVAILDVVRVVHALPKEKHEALIREMEDIGKMLSGLLRWVEKQGAGERGGSSSGGSQSG